MSTLKIFIFGSPRSGTSIAYYAMREVLGLKGYGESHVFPIFHRMLHQFYTYKSEFDPSVSPLARQLDVAMLREGFHEYIRIFYKKVYQSNGFVDKTPGAAALRTSDFVFGAFPDAKVILMQRNGIEVVVSHQRKFRSDFEAACQAWVSVAHAARQYLERHPSTLVIDQFDLTNKSEEVSARLAQFLDRPDIEDKLVSFFSARRVGQHSSHDWTRRLLLSDTDWNEDQKLVFRMTCGDQMTALGYEM